MNQVLKEIECGQLFPSSTYYRQLGNTVHQQSVDTTDLFNTTDIYLSRRLFNRIAINKKANKNDDNSMFETINALDKEHSYNSGLNEKSVYALMDAVEERHLVRVPQDVSNAHHLVHNCYTQNEKTPLDCSAVVKDFVKRVNEYNFIKENGDVINEENIYK